MGAKCFRSGVTADGTTVGGKKMASERHHSDKDRYAVDPTRRGGPHTMSVNQNESPVSPHAIELLIAEGRLMSFNC